MAQKKEAKAAARTPAHPMSLTDAAERILREAGKPHFASLVSARG